MGISGRDIILIGGGELVPKERPAHEFDEVRNFHQPKDDLPSVSEPNDELSFAERWPY
jgi:hypothetical protein